jgi:uncharacterized protein (TIGR03382 family)
LGGLLLGTGTHFVIDQFKRRSVPPGLSLDATTGQLRWTPTRHEVGTHPLRLTARTATEVLATDLALEVTCPAPPPLGVACGCGTGAPPLPWALGAASLLALSRRRRLPEAGRARAGACARPLSDRPARSPS